MEFSFPTRRRFFQTVIPAAALTARFASAASFWEKKQFEEWSDEEARRMLIDSPWAIPFSTRLTWEKGPDPEITYKDVPGTTAGPVRSNTTAPGGSPVGGIGAPMPKLPTEADLILRWASAPPIRQAKVLLRWGSQYKKSFEARDLLSRQEPDYVLEIFGLPAIVGHKGLNMLALAVKQGTTLTTHGGRVLRPVEVTGEVRGLNAHVQIHISKEEPLTVEDRSLRCLCDAGLFKFEKEFNLRKMAEGRKLLL